MTATTDDAVETVPDAPPRSRLRPILTLVAVVLVAAAGAITYAQTRSPASAGTTSDNTSATSTVTVARRDLTAQTQVDGTLVHDDTYTVVNRMAGTLTALPQVGDVVSRGRALYYVDGKPVILLYGSTPAYRALAEGDKGADVRELNANLVALGYATKAQLDPASTKFGWRTAWALKKLQKHLGLTRTGRLDLGRAVFLPSAARVTTLDGKLATPAQPGSAVIEATSTARVVSVDLDVALQTEVKTGDKVTVTLPDGSTVTGVVADIGTVATAPAPADGQSGTSTVPVTITLDDSHAAAGLDQAPVVVSITTETVKDALVVPVNALLALAGGGYAVETVTAGRHALVAVTAGLFDDAEGLVQVTGTGLAAGTTVVVPGQ